MVSGKTKVYAIFGHPVEHSFSPAMHNAAFGRMGLDCVYVAFDVAPGELAAATAAVRALRLGGVNVTIPHKERIMEFLDGVSAEARLAGAVNTVVRTDEGRLEGYTTDVPGFLRALREELGFEPHGKSACVLGAGGAARAVVTALLMEGARRIWILNRTSSKAETLADYFSARFPEASLEALPLGDGGVPAGVLAECDIVVNSTSLGMVGMEPLDIDLSALKRSACVYDLVYNPRETDFVRRARSQGHRAAGGLGMLVYQGAESLRIWTGREPPVDVMAAAIGGWGSLGQGG